MSFNSDKYDTAAWGALLALRSEIRLVEAWKENITWEQYLAHLKEQEKHFTKLLG